MNSPWVICLAREDAAALAALRRESGVEVAESGAEVWIRGPGGNEALDTRLAALPIRERYELLAPNQLRSSGHRVPTGRLPELRWQPLSEWLLVESPTAGLPGDLPATVSLQLVRSTVEREPELLLTSLEEFAHFAARAPRVRLESLEFAAAADGRVLVRGKPLPSIPGQRLVLRQGVAVPAGFAWQPAVGAEVMARRLGASTEWLVLWNADGAITRFHGEQFLPASRSAIRNTQRALAAEST